MTNKNLYDNKGFFRSQQRKKIARLKAERLQIE